MKKVFGIFLFSCMCILLGLSVKWSREERLTLVSLCENTDLYCDML